MQHIQSVEGVFIVLPAPIRVRTNHPTHIVAPFPKNGLNILPITAKFLHFNEHEESKLLAAISLNKSAKETGQILASHFLKPAKETPKF